jgi:hypothetical protein
MKLKMVRKGTFQCYWKSTENMCGLSGSQAPSYNYVCEIECGPVLDKHGFLVDQLDVDKYFQEKYRKGFPQPARSCERTAMECLNDVKYMVETHMMKSWGYSDIRRIAVTIFVNEVAAMTAEWSATDGKPLEGLDRKQNNKADGGQRSSNPADTLPRAANGRFQSKLEAKRGRDSVTAGNSDVRRVPSGSRTGSRVFGDSEPYGGY